MSTLEFKYAEFYCQVCGTKCGFLEPTAKTWTEELQKRHDELRKVYDEERKQRRLANNGRDSST